MEDGLIEIGAEAHGGIDVGVDGVHRALGDEGEGGEGDGALPEVAIGGGEQLQESEACGFERAVGVDEVFALGGHLGLGGGKFGVRQASNR